MMRIPSEYVPRSQQYRFNLTVSDRKSGIIIGRDTLHPPPFIIMNTLTRRSIGVNRGDGPPKSSFNDYLEFYFARKKVYDGDRLD